MDSSSAQPNQLMPLNAAKHGCTEADPSFFSKKGVIIQFVNHNGVGSTTMIGGIRINVADIREIPAYVDLNKYRIKRYAVKALERHLRTTQCATGVGESLTEDDYGVSFSLATISPNAAIINPSKRHEGPLFYCLLEGLVDPIFIGRTEEGGDDYAHVVNCFIHLLPPGQRRISTQKRLELQATTAPIQPAPSPINANKRVKQNNNQNLARNQGQIPDRTDERMTVLEREIQNLRGLHLPNPALPIPEAPPIWRQDGQSSLPDDLWLPAGGLRLEKKRHKNPMFLPSHL